MIILKEQIEPQELKFIPRQMSADTIVLKNETTGVETNIIADFFLSDYYLTTTTVFDLKENTYYNLSVLNNSSVVYKDKIFCTNQIKSDYTVNENTYVENTTTNEFRIYE
jgi:hypothetical protein